MSPRVTLSRSGASTAGGYLARTWDGDRPTAVLDVATSRALGTISVLPGSSVVDPRCRDQADEALRILAGETGLRPEPWATDEMSSPGAWRIVDDTVVVWATVSRREVVVHARELVAEGPVPVMRTEFEEREDADGYTWMFVGPMGIESRFPRRGVATACYDVVEEFTGREARPNAWKGAGGVLCGEAIYALWRRRLASKGIEADDHLWRMLVRNIRAGMDPVRLADLDAEVASVMAANVADERSIMPT